MPRLLILRDAKKKMWLLGGTDLDYFGGSLVVSDRKCFSLQRTGLITFSLLIIYLLLYHVRPSAYPHISLPKKFQIWSECDVCNDRIYKAVTVFYQFFRFTVLKGLIRN